MSEALGDDLGVDAGLQGEGGVRVAQVVQSDRRQHRPSHRLPEVARHRLGVERGAVLGREHVGRVDPGRVSLSLFVKLACCLTLQDLDRARIEGDDTASLDGLRL